MATLVASASATLGCRAPSSILSSAPPRGILYARSKRTAVSAATGDKQDDSKEKAAPSGLQVLFQKAFRGGKQVAKGPDGFTNLMQSLGDGIVERNFGTGGSWPDAAEARRKGVCPRCGASTAEALAAAEAAGTQVDPGSSPVELAAAGLHPLGWCQVCATKDRLLDVSQSF
eukprot:jgi/Tetstr1/431191/TSEL_020903.t1